MADMDTASKRLSTLDWDQPWNSGLAIPDASVSAGDRQQGMWTYSGIALATAAFEMVYWEGEVDSSVSWVGEIEVLVYLEGEVDTSVPFAGEVEDAVYREGEVDTSITEGGII